MNSYMIVAKNTYPLYIQVSLTNVYIITRLAIINTHLIFFFIIRANNFYISGNWSEVYIIGE